MKPGDVAVPEELFAKSMMLSEYIRLLRAVLETQGDYPIAKANGAGHIVPSPRPTLEHLGVSVRGKFLCTWNDSMKATERTKGPAFIRL